MIGSGTRKAAHFRAAFLIVGVMAVGGSVGSGAVSCSRSDSRSNPAPVGGGGVGSVGFELVLSSVAEILTVKYTITGNGIAPITRMIDVTNSTTARAVVTGIPAGTGYLVELTAVSTDKKTTCAGSATFNIVDGQTAQADIVLQCKGPGAGSAGGVMIGGTFDNCPIIRSLTVAPLSAAFGGVIKLDAMGSDPDGDALTYLWSTSAAVGAFMSTSTASTTFTCTVMAGGGSTLTLSVTDGTCTSKVVVQVACCAGSSTSCSVTGAGGAGGGAGGAMGPVGSGGTGIVGGTGGGTASGGSVGTGGNIGAAGVGGAGGTARSGGAGGNSGSGGIGGTAGGGGPGGVTGSGGGGGMCAMPPSECVDQRCNDCTMLNCSPSTDGCVPITDPAERKLCEDLYACATAPSHPGSSVPGPCTSFGDTAQCWCGTNPTTCLTAATGPTAANGPCLQEVIAAAHSSDPGTIKLRFIDPSYPLGRAFNLVSCRGAFCGTSEGTGMGECPIP